MTAPLRKSRPHVFWGQTTSLCETCLELVPAKIQIVDDDVFYEKRCPTHGVQSTLVSTDAAYWKRCKDYIKPGDTPLAFQSRTEHGCPWDCGLCPDHEQHSCLALIEINEHCNLTCPVCFAGSSPQRPVHLPLATIEQMLDALVASEGEPDLLQISGGEPTLHPDFFAVLDAARARPIRHVMVNTNGLLLAQDPDFCARLAERRRGLEIYLQFDSLERDALMDLRGADLRRIRQQALENLERHGISTTLVVTVKRGVNDHEIGALVKHALTWQCVRGVTFQPVQDAGRNDGFDARRNRIVLSEIRRRVIADSGLFGEADMIPLPCNPETIAIAYGLRSGDRVLPVTSMLSREDLVAVVPNTISFEKQPALQQTFVELFSLSSGAMNAPERLAEFLCCLPRATVPEGLSYENVFRVAIVSFMDRFSFCLGGVKRSCIHFVTPDGRIIPFDTYNLFYRNGHAEAIRARRGAMR
ncbi:radical SAM protein [Rhodoplanes sp. TEM]|uniref:Radical SAM protein n=1 Tax=Rhodoplanes tepidamans TaxID=200616 RepID=A0ABT5J3F2_RHOTP|nr:MULTISPECIES: radical SAM protein [Rhodoplanes]MDC7784186.1 radical SAM protein [Rhodoplanes tepidamans]MDC7987634.1 radical SAM protein [Rhodoplanes sp. TEM]MDQ0356716.1 putative radical SAM superfamily Fe-S cluster-containing enzyme [Rhodoplanes tepidamans]